MPGALRPVRHALAAGTAMLALAGCPSMRADPPPPQDNPAYAWVQAGQLTNGCLYYIKRPRQPGVMVDQALWYQRADGSMTANEKECAPR